MNSVKLLMSLVILLLLANIGFIGFSLLKHKEESALHVIFVPVSPAMQQSAEATLKPDYESCADRTTQSPFSETQLMSLVSGVETEALLSQIDTLVESKAVTLSEQTHQQILKDVQSIAQNKRQIAQLRNERHDLNVQLMKEAENLTTLFTREQLDYILANRDSIAWDQIDSKFWEELIRKWQ